MKLSTKGRQAVTAMIHLALSHKRGPVTLADISTQQSISVSYLEQLFARLRESGLVNGQRGPGGGYTLGRAASEITVADILNAVDNLATRTETTVPAENGASLRIWNQLSRRIYNFLNDITLAEVIEEYAAGHESQQNSEFGPNMERPAA
jgi:Rrf2 family iron-sulfur cluster assembly transcriptional regulator